MNSKTKKFALIGAAVAIVGVGAFMALQAFNDNLVFFFSPSQVAANEAPQGRTFRLGGVVEPGSVKRLADGVTVQFKISDTAKLVPVQYKGILPDLFAEGQGVVALGKLDDKGLFTASEVLAKHDENYMPPEAAKALEDAHKKGVEKAHNVHGDMPPGAKMPANHP
ncbi:MAG: cytochrome c maturation protein CcmE [Sutterella sp.]|nr:cytochrome c maturation protein CcmE [Sutterella sp.]